MVESTLLLTCKLNDNDELDVDFWTNGDITIGVSWAKKDRMAVVLTPPQVTDLTEALNRHRERT